MISKYMYKTHQVRTPDTFLVHFVSSAVWLSGTEEKLQTSCYTRENGLKREMMNRGSIVLSTSCIQTKQKMSLMSLLNEGKHC